MTSPTRLLLLADTHLPRRARDLPAGVWAAVDEADLVLHAGDWVDVSLLDALERRSRQARRLLRQQRRPRAARAPAGGGPRGRGGAVDRRGPRDRSLAGSRGALRRPVPGRRRPGLRAQPHSLGQHDTRRTAAAQPGVADRPSPPAALHLDDGDGGGRGAARRADPPPRSDRREGPPEPGLSARCRAWTPRRAAGRRGRRPGPAAGRPAAGRAPRGAAGWAPSP